MTDKARQKTEKILNQTENKIGKVYKTNPALKRIQKEYANYMDTVKKLTNEAYVAYINETNRDAKVEKKNAYINEIRALTIGSAKYNALVRKIARVMADVNQKALNIVNDTMTEIYAINYNQVAEDCKKIGIKVNG